MQTKKILNTRATPIEISVHAKPKRYVNVTAVPRSVANDGRTFVYTRRIRERATHFRVRNSRDSTEHVVVRVIDIGRKDGRYYRVVRTELLSRRDGQQSRTGIRARRNRSAAVQRQRAAGADRYMVETALTDVNRI